MLRFCEEGKSKFYVFRNINLGDNCVSLLEVVISEAKFVSILEVRHPFLELAISGCDFVSFLEVAMSGAHFLSLLELAISGTKCVTILRRENLEIQNLLRFWKYQS